MDGITDPGPHETVREGVATPDYYTWSFSRAESRPLVGVLLVTFGLEKHGKEGGYQRPCNNSRCCVGDSFSELFLQF